MSEGGDSLGALLDRRPLLLVLAGPTGAGTSTFFHTHLSTLGLRFINADLLGRELDLDARQAMAVADGLRAELIRQRESFITETVFSDPVGAKLEVFTSAMAQGYTVVLLYIGVSSAERSDERVAMRVLQGGYDVPPDRIIARFPRCLVNLRSALIRISAVLVYDNDDLSRPYRLVARTEEGSIVFQTDALPEWLTELLT